MVLDMSLEKLWLLEINSFYSSAEKALFGSHVAHRAQSDIFCVLITQNRREDLHRKGLWRPIGHSVLGNKVIE